MKMLLVTFLTLVFYQSHAQLKTWERKSDIEKQDYIRITVDSIVDNKSDNEDRKAVLMYDLALLYILSENDDSTSIRLEAALIGLSNLSSAYFYHEFQVHFQKNYLTKFEPTLQSSKIKSRVARIYFILSFPRDGIITEYYNTGIKLMDKKNSSSFDCNSSSSDISNKLSYKKATKDYFNLAIYCPDKLDQIEKLKLFLFFSLKSI